jgi:hypothetical protein
MECDTCFDKASQHALYTVNILPLEMKFAMYLEINALEANHFPLLSSNSS